MTTAPGGGGSPSPEQTTQAEFPEGAAVVWCEGAFATTNGKTAHGLVRGTERYRILAVIDSTLAGRDAGEILDGRPCGIPMVANLDEGLRIGRERGLPATHLVVGLAPDGGRLPPEGRRDVFEAVRRGLNVDSGLHDFLTEDEELCALAREKGVKLRDVRCPPKRKDLHFFSGTIAEVTSVRIAALGTDSAVGKRTTARLLVEALNRAGLKTVMIGTGQTGWMQGARYGIILDSLINDFVAGELEHAVWSAWHDLKPDVIVIEGQGSLMNPAYPGGFEILAACRPNFVMLQHAPRRLEYDGFPGCILHPLKTQIQAVELLSGRPVAAITLNHEGMTVDEVPAETARIREETGLPCIDPLVQGGDALAEALRGRIEELRRYKT